MQKSKRFQSCLVHWGRFITYVMVGVGAEEKMVR